MAQNAISISSDLYNHQENMRKTHDHDSYDKEERNWSEKESDTENLANRT